MSIKCHLLLLAVCKATGWSPSSTPWFPGLPQQATGTSGSVTICSPVPCILNKSWKNLIPALPLWPHALIIVMALKWPRISSEFHDVIPKKGQRTHKPKPLCHFIIPTWGSRLSHSGVIFWGPHYLLFMSFPSPSFPFSYCNSSTPWLTPLLNHSSWVVSH